MSDSLILEHLRAIRAEAAEDRAEQREQRVRLGAIGRSLAHVERDVSELRVEMNGRLDRVADRLDRIERRLDLADTES
jgi:putative component of toxin-antitoxin plasmid stabilization module